ncbi:YezD family protein [Candidatus Microgenomates bacterium]|nr:YezD family protein [Candidatus Microgenomates bacterium]
MVDYSTKKITKDLIEEVKTALKNVRGWGSVEMIVQDHKVTQITERNIKKTSHSILDL